MQCDAFYFLNSRILYKYLSSTEFNIFITLKQEKLNNTYCSVITSTNEWFFFITTLGILTNGI